MRQAKLDTDELKTGTLGHKTDTELQKSAETTRHENIENDMDIELNATAQRETLEATPGIEIRENRHPQSHLASDSHFITRVQRPMFCLSPSFRMSIHRVVPNSYQISIRSV